MGNAEISNNLVTDEVSHTPSDTVLVLEPYQNGFRVGGAGDVTFRYKNGNTFTRTYAAGDEVFGKIDLIKSTGTTATGITVFRIME